MEVREIALIGHSMGGLVARSACHQAAEHGHRWPGSVGHVVSLGTPHMGAPLAQAVHWLTGVLGGIPEGKAFTEWLRRRSAGIRDLRHGSLVDEDWHGRDPDGVPKSPAGIGPSGPANPPLFAPAGGVQKTLDTVGEITTRRQNYQALRIMVELFRVEVLFSSNLAP